MSKNRPITIGGTTVEPGHRAAISLPIADLYTGTSLSMPVKVISGRRDGPVIFICAAIHGDELNGVEIIRRLLKRNILRSMRGTLIAVPIVNVHGFLDQSRYLPDRRDLNRSFPGSPRGSIAARMANTFITQIVAKAECGLDLHTGAINRSNLPQIRANLDDARTFELARAFGAPVIIDADVRDGSLRGCAAELGIPTLIYEAGEALRFDETSIRAGLRGIFNVMRAIGMLPEKSAAERQKRFVEPVVARSTRWVRAPESGIVHHRAKLGRRVEEGSRLATISDPIGRREDVILAPFDGIVIGRSNLPLAHEGDALFHLGSFRDVPKAEGVVETFAHAHEDKE